MGAQALKSRPAQTSRDPGADWSRLKSSRLDILDSKYGGRGSTENKKRIPHPAVEGPAADVFKVVILSAAKNPRKWLSI